MTGIEIRVFLVIDALSRFSGMAFACSADLPLLLAKQLLDSTAIGVACGGGRTGVDVTVDSWRGFRNPPLTPRIPRFLIPANTDFNPEGKITDPDPESLARAAIESVGRAQAGKDGISYLIGLREAGVETALTARYVAESLSQTGAYDLVCALRQLKTSKREGLRNGQS